MAWVVAAEGLLVDRHHRGAIVMTNRASFAIPEAAIRLVERVTQAGRPYALQDDDEGALARVLLERGILTGVEPLQHHEVYREAAIYDLAFSYRKFEDECSFLTSLYEARRGRSPCSFLELGAGPARHALEMRARGLDVTALDLRAEMSAYAEQLARERGLLVPYLVADMSNFSTVTKFDLAATMLCSATYLLTDDAFLKHLACVSAALAPDGLYVLELPFPRDPAGRRTTKSKWTVRGAIGVVDVSWEEGESRSPDTTSLCDATFLFQPVDATAAVVVRSRAATREFARADVERLVEESARFRVIDVFGALSEQVSFDSPAAWRMLVVLERR